MCVYTYCDVLSLSEEVGPELRQQFRTFLFTALRIQKRCKDALLHRYSLIHKLITSIMGYIYRITRYLVIEVRY